SSDNISACITKGVTKEKDSKNARWSSLPTLIANYKTASVTLPRNLKRFPQKNEHKNNRRKLSAGKICGQVICLVMP
ncbi:MAG: hypothetical protein KAJ45_01380, partial [Desulfobulbaceae bacterium]|nr:hypothetical protein [Desulfobulbaceae bacterium]